MDARCTSTFFVNGGLPMTAILLLLAVFSRPGVPPVTGTCLSHALGMESEDIPDNRLQASSSRSDDPNNGPQGARLNSDVGWMANMDFSDTQWIQVDLGEVKTVSGVVTQGRKEKDEGNNGLKWVITFKVFYGYVDLSESVLTADDSDAFSFADGNTDNDSPVVNMFPYGVEAQFVLIKPTNWSRDGIGLRFELLGCIDVSNEEGTLQSTKNYIDDVNEAKRWELLDMDGEGEKRFTEPEEGVMLWTSEVNNEIASIEVSDAAIQLFPLKLNDENNEPLGVVIIVVNSSEVEAEQSL